MWLAVAIKGPLSILNAGHFSVILFFVLSGFVLALPYARGSQQPYFDFAVKRVCRLYPPAAAAVLIAAALFEAVNAGMALPHATDITLKSWSSPVTPAGFERHLALAGYPASSIALDPPLWSLIVELRASLAFPLLIMIVTRCGWASAVLGIAAAFVCGRLNALHGDLSPYAASTFAGSMLLTVRYFVFFIFGINIAFYLRPLQAVLRRIPATGRIALCILIYLANWIMTSLCVDEHGYGLLLYGIFASYLIACCLTFAAPARLLEKPVFAWLGKISFSLYLIHMPVMLAGLYLLSGILSLPVGIAISLPPMLITASAMQRFVEAPSVRLSKCVGRFIAGPAKSSALKPVM